jgi:putative endonuclease
MAFTYIIYSKKLDRFYIGATQDSVHSRIEKHNSGHHGKNHFTAKADDWLLFLSFETKDYAHAIRIERKIKAMKSKIYINNLKKYPELKTKIYYETLSS